MAGATTTRCPECGATLPVHDGFVTWCHECGWNLGAPEPEVEQGPLGRMYATVGRRLGDRLAAELVAAESLEPRLTPAKLAAYAIAGAVHGFSLLLVASGIALIAFRWLDPSALVAGIPMVALGLFLRPRTGRLPEEGLLRREDAPSLHSLVDEVAAGLETPSADVVAIDHEYNASWAIVGLRGKRLLTLGLPLLTALEPQERVALVAHELAHGRNGDASRGLFVGSAIRNLAEVYDVLRPDEGEASEVFGPLEHVARWVQYLVSRPVLWLLLLLHHLLLRDTQRAEYLADALAARVAGTDAVVSLHEKTLLEPTFRAAVQRTAAARDGGDVFAELERAVARVPERERERRRRVARLERTRLDRSHPPTARRIELLERRPPQAALVRAAAERSRAVDAELARLRPELARTILDEHRDRLYYG